MISYNTKDWFTFIFKIHKSETFRQLIPLMIGVGAYAILIAFLEHIYLESDSAKDITKNISGIYNILGFTLSLLLVFRTNSAYDRWWEGRKLWGELTNVSRSFAAQLNALLPESDKTSRLVLHKYISLFAFSLQLHLKNNKVKPEHINLELIDPVFDKQRQRIIDSYHQPQEIYTLIVAYCQQLKEINKIDTQQIYLFKPELTKFIDVCGACERIKNTPIPFSYSVFLKKFIFFYVMLFPLIYGMQMSYFVIPATIFVLYVLASIELIAEEIEDPFNGDAHDLPTLAIALNIKKSAESILIKA